MSDLDETTPTRTRVTAEEPTTAAAETDVVEGAEKEDLLAREDLASSTDLFEPDPLEAAKLEELQQFEGGAMFEPAEALAGAAETSFTDAFGEGIDTAGGSLGDYDAFGAAPEGRGDIMDMDLLNKGDMPVEQQIADPEVAGWFGDAVDAVGGAIKGAAQAVYDGVMSLADTKEAPPERQQPAGMSAAKMVQPTAGVDPDTGLGTYYDTGNDDSSGITFTEALAQEELKQDSVVNPTNDGGTEDGTAPLTGDDGEPLFIRKSDGYTDPVQEQVDVQLIDPETAIQQFNHAGPEYDPNQEPDPELDPSMLPPGGWNGGGGDGDGGDGGGGGGIPTEG